MTTNHHTPITTGAARTAANVNAPLSQLDSEITAIETELGTTPKGSFASVSERLDENETGWLPYSTVIPTRASADDPIYVLTFASVDLTSILSVGMRVKWTQNSTVRYGIITAISFSTDTTLTLYGGIDYDVDDTATYAISDFSYSDRKAPLGFPLDPTKWTVVTDDTTNYAKTSPSASTWYNAMDSGSLPSISIPIGAWHVFYELYMYASKAAATSVNMFCTLSTSTGTESDSKWTGATGAGGASGTLVPQVSVHKALPVVVASKTVMYLNIKTNTGADSINLAGAAIATKIRAICAYL